MNKKGFTLMEMIAVIAIIGLLLITVLPSILVQLDNRKGDISDANKKMIFAAMDNYLEYHKMSYPLNDNKVYCFTLETLVNAGELETPIKDLKSGNDIPLNKVVKVVVNQYNDAEYTLVEQSECTPKS